MATLKTHRKPKAFLLYNFTSIGKVSDVTLNWQQRFRGWFRITAEVWASFLFFWCKSKKYREDLTVMDHVQQPEWCQGSWVYQNWVFTFSTFFFRLFSCHISYNFWRVKDEVSKVNWSHWASSVLPWEHVCVCGYKRERRMIKERENDKGHPINKFYHYLMLCLLLNLISLSKTLEI